VQPHSSSSSSSRELCDSLREYGREDRRAYAGGIDRSLVRRMVKLSLDALGVQEKALVERPEGCHLEIPALSST
jgi:hypothetical protein